jgi:hypothetical protein
VSEYLCWGDLKATTKTRMMSEKFYTHAFFAISHSSHINSFEELANEREREWKKLDDKMPIKVCKQRRRHMAYSAFGDATSE